MLINNNVTKLCSISTLPQAHPPQHCIAEVRACRMHSFIRTGKFGSRPTRGKFQVTVGGRIVREPFTCAQVSQELPHAPRNLCSIPTLTLTLTRTLTRRPLLAQTPATPRTSLVVFSLPPPYLCLPFDLAGPRVVETRI